MRVIRTLAAVDDGLRHRLAATAAGLFRFAFELDGVVGAVRHRLPDGLGEDHEALKGVEETGRKALTEMVVKATKTKSWAEALEKNSWTPALMTGKEFEDFVDREFASLRATMVKAGML